MHHSNDEHESILKSFGAVDGRYFYLLRPLLNILLQGPQFARIKLEVDERQMLEGLKDLVLVDEYLFKELDDRKFGTEQ